MTDDDTGQQDERAAAVALKSFDSGTGQFTIPKITAVGYGKIAEQILQIAFDNGVKVREDSDLAQMLVKLELESEIPSEALIAVAEILSYVYKVNGHLKTEKQKSLETNRNDGSRDRDTY